jgi:glycosyltransferase involved in cell wall biosynthesis
VSISDLPAHPLISVALPARNNARTIELAIRSILAQDYDHFELLLLDDGSTDDTLAVMRSFNDPRIRVFSDGAGRRLPARLNQAIGEARGELFARMDGDDVAYPDRFRRQVERLLAADAPDVVGAGVAVVRDDLSLVGVRRPAPDHATITASPATGFGLAHPTWMGRTAWFRRWRYRESAIGMEDQDLLLRAYRDSRYANVPELLLAYREPRLDLRKIGRTRRHMAMGYAAEHRRQGNPALALQAVAGQAVRMAVDTVAIGTGLGYRLLSHRAQPATPDEARQWETVAAGLGVTVPTTTTPAGPSPTTGRRPRIALVTTIPASLNFFRGQPAAFREHGYETHAVASPGPELEAFAAREGAQPWPVAMTRQITPPKDVVALARLVVTFARMRPDIVHASTPKGGLLGMLAGRLTLRPVRIFHIHGLPHETRTGLSRTLLIGSTRVAATLADRVICVGPSVRDQAVRDGIVRRDKTVILAHGSANGVDAAGQFNPDRLGPDPRRAGREQLGLDPDGLVVGFVGRLAHDKGLDDLVGAWRTLRESDPALRLLIVGPDEPDDPVSPATMAALQSDDRIILAGPVSDPAAAMAAMDVFVLPTYREGLGLVLIEAGAMRVPVVATAVTGCVDAVVDGVTGTLVPAHAPDELAAAIATYLADPELRERHGAAGRERALRDFDPAAIRAATLALYDSLLGAGQDRGN